MFNPRSCTVIRDRLVAAVVAVGLGLCVATSALAQESVMVRSFAGAGGGSEAVTRSALDRYAELLNLDAAQKEAAASLHEAYQSATREQQRKLQSSLKSAQADLQEDAADAAMRRIPEIIARHGEDSGRLTRQFLDDLKSILTAEQVEQGWPKLERYRRRAAWLKMGPISGSAVDLTEVVAKLNLGAELTATVRPTLDRYEVDLDRALVEREAFEKADGGGRGFPAAGFDPEAMGKRVKFDRENAAKVRDINRRYQRQIAALLPDEEKARFGEVFQAACFRSIYRPTHTARTLQAAEKFDDLTPEQRERLRAIMEAYTREIKAANDRWAAAQERAESEGKAHAFPVLTLDGADDAAPADLKDARAARRELEKNTSEQLAGLLTDGQRARLPQRGAQARARAGTRVGTRIFAADDGSGQSRVMVVTTDDDGPVLIDDEDEGGEGDTIIRQVIIERHEESGTPTAPPPPPPPQPK